MRVKKVLLALFLMVFALFSSIFLNGCAKDNPFIIFSQNPILEGTVPEHRFIAGNRIYYAIVHPKGFEQNILKVQIFKKDEKSEYWGYSYAFNRTCELTHEKFYRDYVVIHTPGLYVMQVFYITDLGREIAMRDFWVVGR